MWNKIRSSMKSVTFLTGIRWESFQSSHFGTTSYDIHFSRLWMLCSVKMNFRVRNMVNVLSLVARILMFMYKYHKSVYFSNKDMFVPFQLEYLSQDSTSVIVNHSFFIIQLKEYPVETFNCRTFSECVIRKWNASKRFAPSGFP